MQNHTDAFSNIHMLCNKSNDRCRIHVCSKTDSNYIVKDSIECHVNTGNRN